MYSGFKRNKFVWYLFDVFVKPCFSIKTIIVIIILDGQCLILLSHSPFYVNSLGLCFMHFFIIYTHCCKLFSNTDCYILTNKFLIPSFWLTHFTLLYVSLLCCCLSFAFMADLTGLRKKTNMKLIDETGLFIVKFIHKRMN